MTKYSVALYESRELVELMGIDDEHNLIYLCHNCAREWADVSEYLADAIPPSGMFCERCDAPQRPLQQLRLGL